MLELLLKLFFLYLPFQFALNPVEGIDLASVRIIIPIVFLIWLINGLKEKTIIIPPSATTLLILSFLFINGLSLFWAENITWGLRKLFFLLSLFPLYFIVNSAKEAVQISILKFLIWGATLSALVGILQFFSQFIFGINKLLYFWAKIIPPFLGNSFSEAVIENSSWLVNVGGHTLFRAVSVFPDPHMFSFYLNISALISLGMFFYLRKNLTTPKNYAHYIYLLLFFILLTASFLTFSRGGYLGLISGLLFFGFFAFRARLKYFLNSFQKMFFLLFALLTFFLTIFFIPNPVTNRLFSSFDTAEGSNSERIAIWKESLAVINNNLFLGTGLGNYSLAIKPSADYREPIYAHNTYLDIMAETGVFSLLIWVLILVFSVSNSLKIFWQEKNMLFLGVASALITFVTHSFFETAIFSIHVLPAIILIIAISNNKISKL